MEYGRSEGGGVKRMGRVIGAMSARTLATRVTHGTVSSTPRGEKLKGGKGDLKGVQRSVSIGGSPCPAGFTLSAPPPLTSS